MRARGLNAYLFYGCFTAGLAVFTALLLWFEAALGVGRSALVGINVAALFCMGLDKSLSRSAAMRIPEVIVYLVALLGGVPGVLLGIHVFKHKTRKASFQFVLLLILVAQVLVMRFVTQ